MHAYNTRVLFFLQEDGSLDNGQSIKTIMDTWTVQTGYPVLTVDRSYGSPQATARQQRFLLVEDQSGKADSQRWWIPLSYAKAGGSFEDTSRSQWMTDQEDSIIMDLTGELSMLALINKSYTPWREGPDGRQIQYKNYICPLH